MRTPWPPAARTWARKAQMPVGSGPRLCPSGALRDTPTPLALHVGTGVALRGVVPFTLYSSVNESISLWRSLGSGKLVSLLGGIHGEEPWRRTTARGLGASEKAKRARATQHNATLSTSRDGEAASAVRLVSSRKPLIVKSQIPVDEGWSKHWR
jgi:hypothetical protein